MPIQILPREPSLAELLGTGLGRGLEAGITRRMEERAKTRQLRVQEESKLRQLRAQEEEKRKSQMERANAFANAFARAQGIEPTSNSPLNEPTGVTEYQEIAGLSPEDIARIDTIRSNRQRMDLASQKMALQETKKFRDNIREGATSAQRMLKSIQNQQKILEKGLKTGPLTWNALMFRVGLRGAASPEAQAFQASLLDYMEGQREKFGVRLTDADLRLILDKLPDIARSRKGNELILSLFQSQTEYELLKKKALQNEVKRGITLNLEERYDRELEKLLRESPQIETRFEDTLNRLYERSEGKEIPGQELLGREFEKMPRPQDYSGVIIEDDKGNRYQSTGKKWRKL